MYIYIYTVHVFTMIQHTHVYINIFIILVINNCYNNNNTHMYQQQESRFLLIHSYRFQVRAPLPTLRGGHVRVRAASGVAMDTYGYYDTMYNFPQTPW